MVSESIVYFELNCLINLILNDQFPVFQRYDPNFISASLDEAYLDITDVCREKDLRSDDVSMLGSLGKYLLLFSPVLFMHLFICERNLCFFFLCNFISPVFFFFFFYITKVAEEIRRSVFEETGLTCSAGVGPNRLLAKVLSFISTYWV